MAPPTGSSSLLKRFVSSMKDLFEGNLGESWQGLQASQAFRKGELKSKDGGGTSLRIAFRNLCPFPILLCWVSKDSQLHHFYKLSPQSSPSGGNSLLVSMDDHIENTQSGDTFCFVFLPEDKMEEAQKKKSLPDTSAIVAGFMPHAPKNKKDKTPVYLVTISHDDKEPQGKEEAVCCQPPFLRKRKRVSFHPIEGMPVSNEHFVLTQHMAKIDPTPYDTSTKFYERKLLGGWPVYMEPNWHKGDEKVEKRLGRDLEAASKILPPHAAEYLRQNCPIWVNSCIKYGPRACPIRAKACCYHPDQDWLVENGLCADKHKCIEINDGPGYTKHIDLWGPGGLMVHELSHAYHHRMLLDGYENKDIEECYNAAMREGLYDCVKVRGSQGPEAKAYACTNCMEYFAELSTAFLGGTDKEKEFNKWFPFNRYQLKEHDPRAYKLLSRLWKIENPMVMTNMPPERKPKRDAPGGVNGD